jgi:hypothetical protein
MSTDDQRAAEPVALAVNPDTGIVHRRMSDGTWYALDAIPGRGAVTGENLLPYLPQTEDDLMMKMHCPCITKSCYHPPAKCSGLPDTKIEMHSSVLGCWQQWTFCRGCAEVAEARWPGEAQIREGAPRSWSLPDPPPDDVTVVHVQAPSGEVFRCVREGRRWRDGTGRRWFRLHRRRLYGFGELLDMGTVVEGEPPAPPVPPQFERGFYRLARDISIKSENWHLAAGTEIEITHVVRPSRDYAVVSARCWPARVVPFAVLAAAGAERIEAARGGAR